MIITGVNAVLCIGLNSGLLTTMWSMLYSALPLESLSYGVAYSVETP